MCAESYGYALLTCRRVFSPKWKRFAHRSYNCLTHIWHQITWGYTYTRWQTHKHTYAHTSSVKWEVRQLHAPRSRVMYATRQAVAGTHTYIHTHPGIYIYHFEVVLVSRWILIFSKIFHFLRLAHRQQKLQSKAKTVRLTYLNIYSERYAHIKCLF